MFTDVMIAHKEHRRVENASQRQKRQDFQVDSFLRNLKSTFGNDAWEKVEPFARRNWDACRMDNEAAWETVRARALLT